MGSSMLDEPVSLPEYMALAALSSLMCPAQPRGPKPDLNKIVFSLFAAVDDDLDGQINESEWIALHRVLHLFGLLPSLSKLGIGGPLDLFRFRTCCKSHLDQQLILCRY